MLSVVIRRVRTVRMRAAPFALFAGMAMAASLAGCDQNGAATQESKAAGNDLKAAAQHAGEAVKIAAKKAQPEIKKLDIAADKGMANVSDATGDAAAKAGHALDRAGERTREASHRAADRARERADNRTDAPG